MLSLVRADWFRIRRRWDVWLILLGVPVLAVLAYLNGALAAGSQFQTSSVGDVPPDLQAQIAAQDAAMQAAMQYVSALPYQFPRSIATLLSGATFWLALGSGFLAASLLGNEFAWGTIRNVVLFRPDRSRYLMVRSMWIAGLVVASLALMIALGALLPTLVPVAPGDPTALSKLDPNQGFIPYGTVGSVNLGGALLIGAATAAAAAAAVALVGLCALKFRSAASGMLGAGIYVVAEGVLAGIVAPHLTGNLRYLPQLSLMNRLAALIADATQAAGLTSTYQSNSPDWYVTFPPLIGAAILAVWIGGLLALWFVVMRRADIHE